MVGTRLTNGFSKKIENHRLACAIHFVHYNFLAAGLPKFGTGVAG